MIDLVNGCRCKVKIKNTKRHEKLYFVLSWCPFVVNFRLACGFEEGEDLFAFV